MYGGIHPTKPRVSERRREGHRLLCWSPPPPQADVRVSGITGARGASGRVLVADRTIRVGSFCSRAAGVLVEPEVCFASAHRARAAIRKLRDPGVTRGARTGTGVADGRWHRRKLEDLRRR